MPRCLHPGQTFDVVLKSDKALSLPPDETPFFKFRPISGLGWMQAVKAMSSIKDVDVEDVAAVPGTIATIYSTVRIGLCGWGNMYDRNVPEGKEPTWIPYDPDKLEEIIDPLEAQELVEAMMASAEITPADKKKSASPPSSVPSRSASHARNGASTRQRR
jgi:hypothetical protein